MKIAKVLSSFFFEILETTLMALGLFVFMYFFLFQLYGVNGDSMLPSFRHGERLIVEKVSYRFNPPQRGDVIVFHYPLNPRLDYIKRIAGLPGERIQLKDGRLFIYNHEHPEGFTLNESYLKNGQYTIGHRSIPTGEIVTIPLNEYAVFGDNRTDSSDSRLWGMVPQGNVVGRAWFCYWPPSCLSFIAHAHYEE